VEKAVEELARLWCRCRKFEFLVENPLLCAAALAVTLNERGAVVRWSYPVKAELPFEGYQKDKARELLLRAAARLTGGGHISYHQLVARSVWIYLKHLEKLRGADLL
jgi:hypothetical protein